MAKEKFFLKKTTQTAPENSHQHSAAKKLTQEERAAIVRDRLAKRPVIVWRYRNGKWNIRFIITLAILIAAMIAALYFISRTY